MTQLAIEHGLTKWRYGCRCEVCCQSYRDWERSRITDTCDGRLACGTNSGYSHGCRDDACGVARLVYQRNKRKSKRPRPSKYEAPTPPAVIDQWKRMFGPRG